MNIDFTVGEMQKILNSLDFYSRIWIGQYDHILWEIRWLYDCIALDNQEETLIRMLMKLRLKLLPGTYGFGWSGSYGIFSDEIDSRAGTAYNMQQEFRYRLAYYEHPEGGITVDFNRPLPVEKDPYPFPKAECHTENGETVVAVTIVPEQAEIIREALQVHEALYSADMRKLFAHYTNDEEALKMADEITEVLTGIPEDGRIKSDKKYAEAWRQMFDYTGIYAKLGK